MSKQSRKGNKKGASTPKNPPLTHFLCVPLVNATSRSQLEKSLRTFKEDVCHGSSLPEGASFSTPRATESSNHEADDSHPPVSDVVEPPQQNPSSIAEKAVRPVGALHLTLGVMSLNATTLTSAISLLSKLDIHSLFNQQEELTEPKPQPQHPPDKLEQPSPSLSPKPTSLIVQQPPPPRASTPHNQDDKPIKVSLKSLTSMHPPHKTSILYTAPEDPTSRLHPLCKGLRNHFQQAGFLIQDTRPLKLHATLVNTIYVKGRKKRGKGKPKDGETDDDDDDRSKGHGPDAKAPLRIDARDILERYKDFVWAEEVRLDRIAICEMGAKKILDKEGEVVGEEYKEVATARLLGP